MKDQNKIKCVVWDLDNTLWDGILLEGDNVKLKPGITEVIINLDQRGILHSVASKGHYEDAMQKLREFNLDKFFLYPQISWNAKSQSIIEIQKKLNIGINTFLFIDDTQYERDEVKSVHPEVTCCDSSNYLDLIKDERLIPKFVTEDSAKRRLMYLADKRRKEEENDFKGPQKEFLFSLNINLIITEAKEADLKRAEELTIRTNQLNANGNIYTYDDLKLLMESKRHKLIICEMNDKYGSYGKIGLALVEIFENFFHIRLLLFSCRVMSAGVGTVLLYHILNEANKSGKNVRADFKNTGRNRMMYVTFKFANFKEKLTDERGVTILENSCHSNKEFPAYLNVILK